jgi:hypothetical protein
MSVSNPFESSESWDVSTERYIGVGNHVAKIIEVGDETSSNNRPKLVLKFENRDGTIRAWEPYHAAFLEKIVALYDAAGIDRPREGEFDPNDECRLNAAARQRLMNQWVGIVVRDEPSFKDPSKSYATVQGYVTPATLGADVPIDRVPQSTAAGAYGDDDIPF